MANVTGLVLSIVSDLVKSAWCRRTASPGCQAVWSKNNPGWGQGEVSALAIQSYLGGDLLLTVVDGYGSHYYNRLPNGTDFDLTRDQFPSGTIVPAGEVVPREQVLYSEQAKKLRTRQRYLLFMRRIAKSLGV